MLTPPETAIFAGAVSTAIEANITFDCVGIVFKRTTSPLTIGVGATSHSGRGECYTKIEHNRQQLFAYYFAVRVH